ncbi:hypothetical protein SAMN05192574_102229 [Mucilaginibacter gossypiicola]|uniref:Uncharacterized protein n=1 Tax=Mucilaginibacter gossypiicola TaxID=551995 RepID=A0A1H8D8R5_9SPHI|nr:hypothetical protein [Mucilaginibacter gossypiicola]SEN02877.1 hypothetical protein SAMN05192574_102229 [Mucilaginibacter gossypiicola]
MEPDEELHSFQFCQEVSGVEHDYRITEMANHVFGVEKDGVVIAEVTNDTNWKQLSGEPLEKALLHKICDRIEDHYA